MRGVTIQGDSMYFDSAEEFVPGSEANGSLKICRCNTVGLGVEAMKDFAAGDELDRFTGQIGPEITQHSLQVRPGAHITQTRFIGFLSHGCDPNCRLDMDRFSLVALRDIAVGDRLTIDYAQTEDVLHTQFACRCGAETCRAWIAGRHDTISADGAVYLATLAPAAPLT